MAIKLTSSRSSAADGIKCIVYGQAGAGKTRLIPSIPDVVMISAERGALSISNHDVPMIDVYQLSDVSDAIDWFCDSVEGKQFRCLAVDSVSEIAENLLEAEKLKTKDPRQAYGETQSKMMTLARRIKSIHGRDACVIAKMSPEQDELGKTMYLPAMPGKKTGFSLAHVFDEIFALRVESDTNGKTIPCLFTSSDSQWLAKDRSGRLDQWELPDGSGPCPDRPNMGKIFAKMRGEV